ncbi:hypothetical protein [Brachyspira pilosicoli]|uniref:Lipoprotein n=1 Tax=Brachyspira pilosicoli TaxID=52584 RepID=A0A5C8EAW0_BRAPL|nr:hypothetical protein [Brachyspira pilosicoli]TXJ35217.1 hypothetical protein EPJ72_12705 [Brachyspira pilosicoli]
MKNILKLVILTLILISCKLENITGTGVDSRFVGTWTGTIKEEEKNNSDIIIIIPPPGEEGSENTEETSKEKPITVIINEDGSIAIDSDLIPASNIYQDIINNVYYYTISYIMSSQENSSTVFNYMIIFQDNETAAIEGTTIITLNQREERIKVPETTINKQTEL